MSYDRCSGGSLFCLGMTDYNCCGTDFVPAAKKRKTGKDSKPQKSLSLKKSAKTALSPTSRFNITANEEQIEKASKGFIPKIQTEVPVGHFVLFKIG